MIQTLSDQAIEVALKQDWPRAISINQQILLSDPHNVACLNRLGRAYKETGDVAKAKETYEHVLEIDPHNTIAQNNLRILGLPHAITNGHAPQEIITNFIEEPGITKTVTLNRLSDTQVFTTLRPGQVVRLVPKTHCIAIHTQDDTYIGSLSDDFSFKLKPLIAKGNQYTAAIKSCTSTHISVFLRETNRCQECANTPSF